MRKIFLFMMVSLDGYFEGPNHDLSWHHVDAEFNAFAIPQTQSVGTLLFGRRTYELMRDYWPTKEARTTDPVVAQLMNTTPKIVFSHTLTRVEESEYWKNVCLVKDNAIEEIKKLKQEEGKSIAVYGSNNLAVFLLEHSVLDEIRIMVNPVAIGNGTPLFAGLTKKTEFSFTDTRKFHNGNVLLTYQVKR